MNTSRSQSRTQAFTLVEIMIVVAIIGVVAMLAIPSFLSARTRSKLNRTANDFRVASETFEMYAMQVGNYPGDVPRGVIPAGMELDLSKMHWTTATAIGGNWDWDQGVFSIIAAVSIVDHHLDNSEMQELDKLIDDGSLVTGAFIQNGTRLMYIIEE